MSAYGKSSFGVFNEPIESGEYTINKKAKTVYCNPNICKPNICMDTQKNLFLLKNSKRLFNNNLFDSFNKNNLNINLITALDLQNVCIVKNNETQECPTTLVTYNESTSTQYPYLIYTIDPSGQLFGNDICQINNFNKYRVPYL